ncbi:MAG TPA: sugar phosphate isomerase/epimerase family protein [Bacillota bacterium]|nr:sugar phosphate isomerase/epimerase [Clostridiales bacterium]HPT84977.1 sugar phosphate isomerase/epimerase family protein [Bacillota bacterium]
MEISTQTDVMFRRFGEAEAIKIFAEAGWDALDYSMFDINPATSVLTRGDFREYARLLRETAEKHGLRFNQAHAPFPSYRHDNEEYNATIFELIVRSMEIAGILGAETIIVHPITHGQTYDERKAINMAFYSRLLPYCEKFGVTIAVENMFSWGDGHAMPAVCSTEAEFVDYIDSLDPQYFCACLDIGHAELRGAGAFSAVSMIRALGGKRLRALHVHDNDRFSDLHTLPFTRSLRWKEIVGALAEIGYSGVFTFEADNFIAGFPPELSAEASKLMAAVGRYLVRDLI